jgi:hypothetical protein
VTGTNFDIVANATTFKLNGVTAASSAASATSATFSVPAGAASGKITATTSGGTGTSARDFLVPPAGVNATDIIASARIAVDGPSGNVAIAAPNKHAMVIFDAAANGFYSFQFSALETSPTNAVVNYKVMKPDNSVLLTGTIGYAARPSIHLPKLVTAGTYSVLLSPGTATLNTNVRVATSPALVVDGAAIATSLDFAYQSARFVFDATAGQRIGIGAIGVAFTPSTSTGPVFLSVYKPDGSALISRGCLGPASDNPQGNCGALITAPTAGTYMLIAENSSASYSNFPVQLTSDATGTLVADVPQDVTLTRVGQDARYTFAASAGDSYGVEIYAAVQQPQAQYMSITVNRPDGTSLASCGTTPPASIYCELGALATAGTYTVIVHPDYGAYGTFKLALKRGPMLATADPATAFAPAVASESARFRFTATAGQSLSLGVFNFVQTGGSAVSYLYVYRPDGTNITWTACSPSFANGGCKLTLTSLPVAGTYGVVLAPATGVRISGSFNLSADLTGALVAGTPQTVNASRAGQNARFTFSGTAGESTSVKLFAIATTPAAQNLYVTVYKPDGSSLAETGSGSNDSALVNLPSLPVTGTYTVLAQPQYGVTWQGRLALDPGALISIDGPVSTLTTTAAGEPLRYRLSGTAGQRVEFGLSGLTYGVASSALTYMNIYRPDGYNIVSVYCFTSAGCKTMIASLPSTGTYSIVFVPPSGTSITGGSFAVSTALAGTLVVGGAAQTIAINRPGQTARYTFSGTAAQLLRLNWSNTVVGSGARVDVSVLNPDGSTLSTSWFANGATGGFDIASLPLTGTYTVVFDPASAASMSAPVTLVTR